MAVKVAVIGAGISGISAGNVLQKTRGIELTIFEATDRIGGRIWTSYENKNNFTSKLELGANWVHGVKDNPIHTIAVRNNLYEKLNVKLENEKVHFPRRDTIALREDGGVIPKELYVFVKQNYASALQKANSVFHDNELRDQYEHTSVDDFIRCEMEPVIKASSSPKDAAHLLDSLLTMETNISGCDSMNQVSVSQFGSYKELAGRQPPIAKGFQQVALLLARDIPSEAIKLNTPVTKIITKDSTVTIETADGTQHDFNAIIVTSPLAFLKRNHIKMFHPPLPLWKHRSIGRLDMGTVDKIYLEFAHLDFIPKNVYNIFIAKQQLSHNWTDKIYSFGVLPSHTAENTLIVWVTGEAALEMERIPDEEEVIAGCMGVLRKALHNKDIPSPVSMVRTSWGSQRFFCGSYTFIPTGASVNDIESLAEPILGADTKPLLMFAGEATHPEFYSTVHGAFLTGQREAQRIINAHNLNEI